MSNSIGLGNEIKVVGTTGIIRWALRFSDVDGGITLVRFNSSGVEQESVLTIDWATGAVDLNEDVSGEYRTIASDGALTLATSDVNGVIQLAASASGAKAATMTTTGMKAGDRIFVYLLARSGGSYTLAASGLTITLDAAGEGCALVFDGSAWQIAGLTGGATAA